MSPIRLCYWSSRGLYFLFWGTRQRSHESSGIRAVRSGPMHSVHLAHFWPNRNSLHFENLLVLQSVPWQSRNENGTVVADVLATTSLNYPECMAIRQLHWFPGHNWIFILHKCPEHAPKFAHDVALKSSGVSVFKFVPGKTLSNIVMQRPPHISCSSLVSSFVYRPSMIKSCIHIFINLRLTNLSLVHMTSLQKSSLTFLTAIGPESRIIILGHLQTSQIERFDIGLSETWRNLTILSIILIFEHVAPTLHVNHSLVAILNHAISVQTGKHAA